MIISRFVYIARFVYVGEYYFNLIIPLKNLAFISMYISQTLMKKDHENFSKIYQKITKNDALNKFNYYSKNIFDLIIKEYAAKDMTDCLLDPLVCTSTEAMKKFRKLLPEFRNNDEKNQENSIEKLLLTTAASISFFTIEKCKTKIPKPLLLKIISDAFSQDAIFAKKIETVVIIFESIMALNENEFNIFYENVLGGNSQNNVVAEDNKHTSKFSLM